MHRLSKERAAASSSQSNTTVFVLCRDGACGWCLTRRLEGAEIVDPLDGPTVLTSVHLFSRLLFWLDSTSSELEYTQWHMKMSFFCFVFCINLFKKHVEMLARVKHHQKISLLGRFIPPAPEKQRNKTTSSVLILRVKSVAKCFCF